jgi:uncharacterized RDD family membrane protein YckC
MKMTNRPRRQVSHDALQAGSLFHTARPETKERTRPRGAAVPQARDPHRAAAPMEIYIQPEFDFESRSYERGCPQTALVPVASLAERQRAGLLDALFITLASIGFIGLFRLLGGEIALGRVDAAVCAVIVYLFYASYFLLFTVIAGATPGMQAMHLAAVGLDGSLPDTRELLWRGFGYLISGATLLGFFWAVWDEEQFTWQDRISRTYLTSAVPFLAPEPTQRPVTGRAFPRK